MPYSVTISGLFAVRRILSPAGYSTMLSNATKVIALELQNEIAPYPRATEANSPSNPTGRWYERGYGRRWLRKDGTIGGAKTSQMLGRRWAIHAVGATGHSVGNNATYAPYVHASEEQASFHGRRGWKTDLASIKKLIDSGDINRIVVASIQAAMRSRR